MVYATETDPLCYPGSTVLRNKEGITDQADLDDYETAMVVLRSEEEWPIGRLDYAHYRALHRHLFQDVYDWAGEPRQIRIGKGGNWFCYPEYIDDQMERIFDELAEEDHLRGLDRRSFSVRSAQYLAEINAIHPFREGNGRTQLAFLTILAENAGFELNADGLERDQVIQAMVDSFSGEEQPLADLIAHLLSQGLPPAADE